MKKIIDRSRVYTLIASGAAFLQVSIPQWGLSDTSTQIASAVLLAVASIFTILKQRVSVEISNNASFITYLLVGVAALGGVNEVIGLVPINDGLQNVLRSVIAGLIGLLNLALKSLFPTEAGQAIQGIKSDLKEGKMEVIKQVNN